MDNKLTYAAIASSALGLALVATPAQSAPDTTPPTLNSPVKASFVVGSQIPVGQLPSCGGASAADLRLFVPEVLRWSGSDNSGSVQYDLVQNTGAFGPEDVFTDSTQTTYDGQGTNRDQFCGGGNPSVYQWDLTAEDPSGNSVTHAIFGGRIRLTQDDNETDDAGYATRPTVHYSDGWSTSSCQCWSAHGIHKTSKRHAAARLTFSDFTVFPSETRLTHVGLVMHTGPDRGRFKVFVDGVLRRTVDTFAPSSRPRVVVWQGALATTDSKIRIVNLATPGRPRIDLDAVLTN